MPDQTPAPADASPIALRAPAADGGALIEGQVQLTVFGEVVTFDIEVPDGPVTIDALLPALQDLSSEIARRSAAKVIREGRSISCRAGCGACCRQAVPIAEAEARAIAALVAAMPEPRQSEIRTRFEAASRRLEEAAMGGVVSALPDGNKLIDVGVAYFRMGVPCPFLEAESCSIHPDRPLRCREYFVTSPAAACVAMAPGTVDGVRSPGNPSSALYDVGAAETPRGWVLLTQALSFAQTYPASATKRSAPEWLQAIFAHLAQQSRVSPGA